MTAKITLGNKTSREKWEEKESAVFLSLSLPSYLPQDSNELLLSLIKDQQQKGLET